jgi:hypothetical protein
MARTLTMMVGHAYPHEASNTGGGLAACSAQGISTAVVTCAGGRSGDRECFVGARDPTGPSSAGYDLFAWLRPPEIAGGATP